METRPKVILLSARQANEMLAAAARGGEMRTSLDLGKSEAVVSREGDAVRLAPGELVTFDALRKIAKNDDSVYTVEGGGVAKLIRFSEETALSYKLRPTADWPALEISGILMHRIGSTTPRRDAESKLKLVAPVLGSVLETCMGLGYTAMLSAQTASSVTAIEKDANVVAMARLNPFSERLFTDAKIRLLSGDAAAVVPTLADASFDIVNHDPPTLSVAGQLYSDEFYSELLRVLRPGGRLLHYTGSPGSKARRVDLGASVARRLSQLGFARVRNDEATGCVVASRGGR